ncbi:MAG: lytic murein transglycosylase [Xanthobacter sp.]
MAKTISTGAWLRGAWCATLALAATAFIAPAHAQAQTTGSLSTHSSHPLMTPQALAQAEANFPRCIASLWPEAQAKGVSRQTFERYTRNLQPDMQIMKYLDSQPEFSKPIGDYVEMLVSNYRVKKGQEILAKYKNVFDAAERAYGVDRYAVAAIWGIESSYGHPSGIGNRNVLEATATLSCIGRRQDYFRTEFIATLQILERGDVPYKDLKGSWAGAFGPTQFMPTSFHRFAVDFDGDGKRDVVNSIPDIIASTANNLKLDGWQYGKTWGYEVKLPPGFDYRYANRKFKQSLGQWASLGVTRPSGSGFPRPNDQAYLLLPSGAKGPAFLMLGNFDAILKYNPADAYALAIGHLSDRLRGYGGFAQSWPKEERGLSRAERVEIQNRLTRMGYDIGPVDGILGSKSRAAIQDFQARSGLLPDGYPDVALLQQMRR